MSIYLLVTGIKTFRALGNCVDGAVTGWSCCPPDPCWPHVRDTPQRDTCWEIRTATEPTLHGPHMKQHDTCLPLIKASYPLHFLLNTHLLYQTEDLYFNQPKYPTASIVHTQLLKFFQLCPRPITMKSFQ